MSNLPTQRIWGKAVGALLGLIVGGPWGAVVGYIIGHLYDQRPDQLDNEDEAAKNLLNNHGGFSTNAEQATFTMGVIVLSAKMAKSDGRVTRAEIEAFKSVFRIAPEQENAVGELFNRARLSADGFEPYAVQLAHVFSRKSAVLEEILGGLFIIGAADRGGLSPAEIVFLKRVSFIFGFVATDFARIAARAGVKLPRNEQPRNQAAESFAILGIAESATAEEAKAAYRRLILKHHPDKLMAQGMPPAFVATATEKMKRINAAYDAVRKIKDIQ